MKTILIFIFSTLLSACGGGGGGSSDNNNANNETTLIATIDLPNSIAPSIVIGNFKGDGNKYALVGGFFYDNYSYSAVPLKIFKLNENGGGEEVTTQILGLSPAASVHVPLVADFNRDGIDDIFLVGFFDSPYGSARSMAYISRAGSTHQLVSFNDSSYGHDATAVDLDRDGDIDVVTSEGKMWINDGAGNFTFKDHNWWTSAYWMHGLGVCAGDFINNGKIQLVMTDLHTSAFNLPISDTVLFEIDNRLEPIASYVLPKPAFDRTSNVELGHDITCRVADINNDGLKDIIVFSRPWDSARAGLWVGERYTQILINRGNFVFEDISNDSSMYQYKEPDYTPIIEDFNNDGLPDIWVMPTFFKNTGSSFVAQSINTHSADFGQPVKFGSVYGLVYIKCNYKQYKIYFTKPSLTFS